MNAASGEVFGLVLAAGKSTRMGKPKMNLPWEDTSILGAVISALSSGGAGTIHIVVNPLRKPQVPENLPEVDLKWIENPDAEVEDMLSSIQAGLKSMPANCRFAMICPGDQPTISAETVKALIESASEGEKKIVFPSYHMRRGHPWMVNRSLWGEILELSHTDNVRSVIQNHQDEITYVIIDSDPPPDIDTPEDYKRLLQASGK
jgi:molybdenum cofactor cytidylyltransferase